MIFILHKNRCSRSRQSIIYWVDHHLTILTLFYVKIKEFLLKNNNFFQVAPSVALPATHTMATSICAAPCPVAFFWCNGMTHSTNLCCWSTVIGRLHWVPTAVGSSIRASRTTHQKTASLSLWSLQNSNTPLFALVCAKTTRADWNWIWSIQIAVSDWLVLTVACCLLKLSCCFLQGSSWFNADDGEIDGTATMVPRRELVNAKKVYQVCFLTVFFKNIKGIHDAFFPQIDKDAILVCFNNTVQIVNLQGAPKHSRKFISQINFEFKIESIGEFSSGFFFSSFQTLNSPFFSMFTW